MQAAKEIVSRNGRTALRQLASQVVSLTAPAPSLLPPGTGAPLLRKPAPVPTNQLRDVSPASASARWRPHSTASGPVAQYVSEVSDVAEAARGALPDISFKDLIVRRTTNPSAMPPLKELKFGAAYSDHMLSVAWTAGSGWSQPVIQPLGPLALHPCAQVLHYAMECFEGMKAYKGPDGRIRLFRPEKNMARLASSCDRLSLPAFNQEEFLECLKALLREDRDWIPSEEGYSIYLRPTCIATTPFLGVGPATEALLFAVLSPVGPYFPAGLQPIKLFVDTKHVRAYPGGVGDRKVGGNYAPTIKPQVLAAGKGCSQVLYALDDNHPEGALVGESGAMNVFFLFRKEGARGGLELVTPPLDGLILPGVTRDSVLGLARSWGEFEVSERLLRLNELEAAANSGRLIETFGTGTAVVVQPISGLILPSGKELTLPYNKVATAHWTSKPPGSSSHKPSLDEPFSLTGRVYKMILDIQYGHVPSNWSIPIDD